MAGSFESGTRHLFLMTDEGLTPTRPLMTDEGLTPTRPLRRRRAPSLTNGPGGIRTLMRIAPLRILSPLRLPVPPRVRDSNIIVVLRELSQVAAATRFTEPRRVLLYAGFPTSPTASGRHEGVAALSAVPRFPADAQARETASNRRSERLEPHSKRLRWSYDVRLRTAWRICSRHNRPTSARCELEPTSSPWLCRLLS